MIGQGLEERGPGGGGVVCFGAREALIVAAVLVK